MGDEKKYSFSVFFAIKIGFWLFAFEFFCNFVRDFPSSEE
jgi:hypothetical protein